MNTKKPARTTRMFAQLSASVAALIVGGLAGAANLSGIDIGSHNPSSLAWSCFVGEGHDGPALVTGSQNGIYNVNTPTVVNNALTAGAASVQFVLKPCPTCGTSGASQLAAFVTALQGDGVAISTIYVDVRGVQDWFSVSTSNQAFFNSIRAEALALGVALGVQTDSGSWSAIMGSYTGGAGLPLLNTASSFSSFGGWTSSAADLTSTGAKVCKSSVNLYSWPQ